MTTDPTASAGMTEPTSETDRPADAPTTATPPRRRRVSVRLGLLIAVLFAVLAVLGGGTGLVVGKIASIGGEHQHHGYSFYEQRGHGRGLFDGDNR